MKFGVDPIFVGPTNPQGSEQKNQKREFEQGKARKDDSKEEKGFRNQKTPRTVFFLLGGKDVISLPYAMEYL